METVIASHWADRGSLSASSEYRANVSRLTDVLLLVLSFVLAHWVRVGEFLFTPTELVITLLFILGFNLTASSLGFYSRLQDKGMLRVALVAIYAAVITVSVVSLGLILTHTSQSFSRIWFVLSFVTGVTSLLTYRAGILAALKNGWLKLPAKRIVIIGSGPLGHEVARRLSEDDYHTNQIVGVFGESEDSLENCQWASDFTLLGVSKDVDGVLEKMRSEGKPVDRVFVALGASNIKEKIALVEQLVSTQYQTYVVPDYSLKFLATSRPDDVAGLPVIDVSHSKLQGARATVKSLMDLVSASIGLLLLSPLLILVSLAIKIETPGPILFRQRRYGIGGMEFIVYKFRSMTVSEDGPNIKQAARGDPRVTRLGKILRSTSIDELPQLFNVINGSMSLVGPRPHAVAHNEMYRKLIAGYMIRHAMKPGITGWAQINGCRGETKTVDQMKTRVDYDKEYMRRWSLGLDIYIILRTILQVLRGDNAY